MNIIHLGCEGAGVRRQAPLRIHATESRTLGRRAEKHAGRGIVRGLCQRIRHTTALSPASEFLIELLQDRHDFLVISILTTPAAVLHSRGGIQRLQGGASARKGNQGGIEYAGVSYRGGSGEADSGTPVLTSV